MLGSWTAGSLSAGQCEAVPASGGQENLLATPALPLASSNFGDFNPLDEFRVAILGGSPTLQEQFIHPSQPKQLWSSLTLVGIDWRGWGKNRKAALGLEKAGMEKEMNRDVVT